MQLRQTLWHSGNLPGHWGAALRRPAFLPLPAFIAELALGEFAREILLNGQRVLPVVAQSGGFSFKYPDLGPALSDILAQR